MRGFWKQETNKHPVSNDNDDGDSEFKSRSAISFARQSNMLTSKYGLPSVPSSKQEEEEDPFDAYMREIES
jgi:hypothetical protein